MKSETNNLQACWTGDPAQQEEFFAEIEPAIKSESARWPRFYGVSIDREDIEQEMRLKLCQQMGEIDADGAFAKDSPKGAADFLKANFKIREPIRSEARNLGDTQRRQAEIRQRRQAEILAKVDPPDLSQDSVKRLFAVCQTLPPMCQKARLTPTESTMLRKDTLRRLDIEGLPASVFDEFAQAAGISGSDERDYIKDHDENGSSARERKVLSRAREKVAKAFTPAMLLTLLTIVLAFALSLASCNAIHQGRSDNQDDLVNQRSLSHQNDLARQTNVLYKKALAHQVA